MVDCAWREWGWERREVRELDARRAPDSDGRARCLRLASDAGLRSALSVGSSLGIMGLEVWKLLSCLRLLWRAQALAHSLVCAAVRSCLPLSDRCFLVWHTGQRTKEISEKTGPSVRATRPCQNVTHFVLEPSDLRKKVCILDSSKRSYRLSVSERKE